MKRHSIDMHPTVLKALRGSIKKWRDIVSGKDGDMGTDNCPLCQLFESGWDDFCDHFELGDCPVKTVAGQTHCRDTPYVRWKRLLDFEEGYPMMANTQMRKEAAQQELNFLKSLLPKKK